MSKNVSRDLLSLNILSKGVNVVDPLSCVPLKLTGVKVEVLNNSCFKTVKERGATSLSRVSLREANADCCGRGAELRASKSKDTDDRASKCSIHWLKSIVKFSGLFVVSEVELGDLEC